jgi:hypothetical protein
LRELAGPIDSRRDRPKPIVNTHSSRSEINQKHRLDNAASGETAVLKYRDGVPESVSQRLNPVYQEFRKQVGHSSK